MEVQAIDEGFVTPIETIVPEVLVRSTKHTPKSSPKLSHGSPEPKRTKAAWELMSEEQPQRMSSLKSYRVGSFNRKPRGLLMPSKDVNLDRFLMTTTLSGDLTFWDIYTREMVAQLTPSELLNGWCEHMTWITPNAIAIAAQDDTARVKKSEYVQHQVALLYDIRPSRKAGLEYQLKHLPLTPHTKGVSVLCQMQTGKDVFFLSGSNDRKICLWKIKDGISSQTLSTIATQRVHNQHTSTVLSLLYQPHSKSVYSGGNDSKFIKWDIEHESNVLTPGRHMAAIRDILPVHGHPDVVCLSYLSQTTNLKVFDTRGGSERCVMTLSYGKVVEEKAGSKYTKAAISPNGQLVAAGTDSHSAIYIFDLRYVRAQSEPPQQIVLHENRVPCCDFLEYRTGKQSLVSIGNDNRLIFTDYQL
ncbi:WD40-repeat-containing domain protein [Gorgonomyces haynaldii]|nr:WD40-repeat-containing domain protein [Gorgonomyces haynaldii]